MGTGRPRFSTNITGTELNFSSMTATRTLLGFALAGIVGCGGDLTLPAPSGEGVVLSIVDGNGQTGRVGEELPRQLVVSVKEDGAAVADHLVAFSIV